MRITMEPVYLSVDVDFFERTDSLKDTCAFMSSCLDYLLGLGVPTNVVTNHHQILKHAAASTARKLINVDAHSDLIDTTCGHLNCGTWVGYVPWRRDGTYVWVRSSPETSWGDCNLSTTNGGIFLEDDTIRTDITDWRALESEYIDVDSCELLPYLQGLNIQEVGLCVSPGFSGPTLRDFFLTECKRRGLRVLRGDKSDNGSRRIWPATYDAKWQTCDGAAVCV